MQQEAAQGRMPASALYEIKSSSVPQKLLMQLVSFGAVIGVAWFLYGEGRATVEAATGAELSAAVPVRRAGVLFCSAVYALRLAFTQFYLIKRRMAWGESLTIAAWVLVIHATMAYLGGTNASPALAPVYIGLVLYLFGSYLNTGSELMRDLWKRRPENKGRLYTEGLFKYSMHINYFGDFVLFTGFALVTGSAYAFIIPMIMAGMFVFVNIPMLDRYLADRYKGQFEGYSSNTAKFIPFVY